MNKVISVIVDENYLNHPDIMDEIEVLNHFNMRFNERVVQPDKLAKLISYTQMTDSELAALGESVLCEILYNDILEVEEIQAAREAKFDIYIDRESPKHKHDENCRDGVKYPTCDRCSWAQSLSMGSYDNSEEEIELLKSDAKTAWIGILIERISEVI